jgi:uncharacterized protein (DUF4415 family)
MPDIILSPVFWTNVNRSEKEKPRSVHLKIDSEVFDLFVKVSGGKGHLTLMQNVLKAYAKSKEV